MIIGPKFKKARKLGVPVFEKTQTPKFAAYLAKKGKPPGRGNKSDYGAQMLEKQRARFSYGVNEKQFYNYVKAALNEKGDTSVALLRMLEGRLDNVVLRLRISPTRSAARQAVSHRHITVNGKVVTIPSYQVSLGDVIGIREGSKNMTIFVSVWEKAKKAPVPAWLKCDFDKNCAVIDGEPKIAQTELLFNVKSVLEYYTR
ncbi:MAG: 30S ribosomal protein S4 [Candidatus Taylorbacteria bacterium]|nr:30S ribosomal protein S4 [Candidatus Taylorbacteria bacterium]